MLASAISRPFSDGGAGSWILLPRREPCSFLLTKYSRIRVFVSFL
jgi:hypothetical protein